MIKQRQSRSCSCSSITRMPPSRCPPCSRQSERGVLLSSSYLLSTALCVDQFRQCCPSSADFGRLPIVPSRISLLLGVGMRNNGAGLVLVATALPHPEIVMLRLLLPTFCCNTSPAGLIDRTFLLGNEGNGGLSSFRWQTGISLYSRKNRAFTRSPGLNLWAIIRTIVVLDTFRHEPAAIRGGRRPSFTCAHELRGCFLPKPRKPGAGGLTRFGSGD